MQPYEQAGQPESLPVPTAQPADERTCIALSRVSGLVDGAAIPGPGAGQPCDNCELYSQKGNCDVLTVGKVMVEQATGITELTNKAARLQAENEAYEEQVAAILERLLNLRTDTLVETAFTPEGLRDHLTHDRDIQESLRHMQWGVLRLDGRFVKYINRYGNRTGDLFLKEGGASITNIADGLARLGDRRTQDAGPPGPERRQQDRRGTHPAPAASGRTQGHSLVGDVICRQGGDEFALIIQNVSPHALAMVAARLQNQLTVGQALDNYSEDKVPFIASVGVAHAERFAPEVRGDLNEGDFWSAFNRVNGEADEGQRIIKSRQYREMWEMIVNTLGEEDRPVTVAMPDENTVASEFLRVLCPDFYRDPTEFLARAQQKN